MKTRINFESFSIKSFIKMSTLLHVITIVQVLPAHYSIGNRFDRHNSYDSKNFRIRILIEF